MHDTKFRGATADLTSACLKTDIIEMCNQIEILRQRVTSNQFLDTVMRKLVILNVIT